MTGWTSVHKQARTRLVTAKSYTAVDAWQAVAQNAILEGTRMDLSAVQRVVLHIDCALTAAVAHTGTEIIIQTSSSDEDDEFWSDFTKVIGPLGTSNAEAITNNPLAALATTITCANTTGYITKAEWRFIEDATIANSELVYQTAYSSDASITILNGVKRAHVQNTEMWNIAEAIEIELPLEAERGRIIYNNTYDADGASIAIRSRATAVSGL